MIEQSDTSKTVVQKYEIEGDAVGFAFLRYESLSSFSNAFYKKFGTRPNEVKQQSLYSFATNDCLLNESSLYQYSF
ncbi:hypothetical protein [Flavobacterium sp.]|uniref:hypothetical protein n=1 Tax=Flavobacterium sp. TaxID=239 RepID=UPI003263C09B